MSCRSGTSGSPSIGSTSSSKSDRYVIMVLNPPPLLRGLHIGSVFFVFFIQMRLGFCVSGWLILHSAPVVAATHRSSSVSKRIRRDTQENSNVSKNFPNGRDLKSMKGIVGVMADVHKGHASISRRMHVHDIDSATVMPM